MTDTPKYSIRRRLLLSDGEFNRNRYLLCFALNISDRTLTRWMSAKVNDKLDISYEHLKALGAFFNCSIDDLINKNEQETAA